MPEYHSPAVTPFGKPAKELVLPKPSQLITPLDASTQSASVDIRAEFGQFIEKYGQMVLLQRMNLNIHCWNCWNSQYGESDPQCPYCLGRGFLSVLERHPSRRMSSLNAHRQQLLTQSAPGPELIDELFWWFEWDINPQLEDIVYEVSWTDGTYSQPNKLITAYRINYAVPMRETSGRIGFWRVAASARPIDHDIVGQHLRRIGPQTMRIADDGVVRYSATYL